VIEIFMLMGLSRDTLKSTRIVFKSYRYFGNLTSFDSRVELNSYQCHHKFLRELWIALTHLYLNIFNLTLHSSVA
jgi:hypothetical protein